MKLSEKEIITEKDLIDNFNETKRIADIAENQLDEYFNAKYKEQIENARTHEDFEFIKRQLKVMPFTVGKVFIFEKLRHLESIYNENK